MSGDAFPKRPRSASDQCFGASSPPLGLLCEPLTGAGEEPDCAAPAVGLSPPADVSAPKAWVSSSSIDKSADVSAPTSGSDITTLPVISQDRPNRASISRFP